MIFIRLFVFSFPSSSQDEGSLSSVIFKERSKPPSMRLGGPEDEEGNGRNGAPAAHAYGDDDDASTASRKRMLIYAALAILVFLMLKSAATTNYEKSTKDYYVSIGREDKAREFYTKKELADEKVQLVAAVERHEKEIEANREEIAKLRKMLDGGRTSSNGSGSA